MPRLTASDADRVKRQEQHEIDALADKFRAMGREDCRAGLPCLSPASLHSNQKYQDWWFDGFMAEVKSQKEKQAQMVGAS